MTEPARLEVVGLTVHHGGLLALDEVSVAVGDGEIAGLIGPNGAGKTTLIDAVTGFVPATGRVVLAGEDVGPLGPHLRARRGLARTFQSLELFDDLTVRDNLRVAASTPSWRSTLADVWRPRPPVDGRIATVLDEVGLSAWADRRPDELSNGQRHLAALARALVAGPSVVLLDEPAAGLDVAETESLGRLIGRLPGLGTSVLLVDHDMALVFGVCDRVHVLDHGRLVAAGTPAEVRADPTVVAAYLGGPVVER